MPIRRLLTGALLCALLPTTNVCAKEQRGLQPEDGAVAKTLPVHVLLLQPRLQPQIPYNYRDMSLSGLNAVNNLYYSGGMRYGQAMVAGLVGGLITGAIINGAELATARKVVRGPYQLIEQASCDLPLGVSHQAAMASALHRAEWDEAGPITSHVLESDEDIDDVIAKDDPRYLFTMSTSFAPDFSALITTVDAAAYVPDASSRIGRNADWRDSLIVVSDGLWLPAKTQPDIEQMVATEKQRYAVSDADELIIKVNAAGTNASRKDRKRAVQMVSDHRQYMQEARREGWSEAGSAMRRAVLWSENHCARLNGALQGNLERAGEMVQALLRHSLPERAQAKDLQPLRSILLGSAGVGAPATEVTAAGVGLPEGAVPDEAAPAKTRVIEALPGGSYVSRLSGENITLGYRHMVLSGE